MSKPVCILIAFVIFFSCSKKKEEENVPGKGPCDDFEKPYVSNDGPVQMGGTLHLLLSSPEQNITYEWTGPKNFLSQDKNPEISNISFDAGGTYYARISNGTCNSSTSPTHVIVNAPCSIGDNSGIFGTETWNFNSAITCGIGPDGHYTLWASSINGSVKIKFFNPDQPVLNKIYGVDDVSIPAFDSANVQLEMTKSTGSVYNAQSGNVFVSNYDVLSVVFCNVPFKSNATGEILTGKVKVSCP